jgi:hypothetical protein
VLYAAPSFAKSGSFCTIAFAVPQTTLAWSFFVANE